MTPEHLGGFEIPESGYVRTRTEERALEILVRTATEELVRPRFAEDMPLSLLLKRQSGHVGVKRLL